MIVENFERLREKEGIFSDSYHQAGITSRSLDLVSLWLQQLLEVPYRSIYAGRCIIWMAIGNYSYFSQYFASIFPVFRHNIR